jgi:hypothetical protein
MRGGVEAVPDSGQTVDLGLVRSVNLHIHEPIVLIRGSRKRRPCVTVRSIWTGLASMEVRLDDGASRSVLLQLLLCLVETGGVAVPHFAVVDILSGLLVAPARVDGLAHLARVEGNSNV